MKTFDPYHFQAAERKRWGQAHGLGLQAGGSQGEEGQGAESAALLKAGGSRWRRGHGNQDAANVCPWRAWLGTTPVYDHLFNVCRTTPSSPPSPPPPSAATARLREVTTLM